MSIRRVQILVNMVHSLLDTISAAMKESRPFGLVGKLVRG